MASDFSRALVVLAEALVSEKRVVVVGDSSGAGALVAAMWFAVQWKTSVSAPATAELWVLPPAVEETTPAPAPAPAPVPVAPEPPAAKAPEPVKPDIVEKREPRKRPQDQAQPTPNREKKPKPVPKTPSAAEMRQQAEAQKRHDEEMQRLTSQAGVTSPTPSLASSGPVSNEWNTRIQAAVRSHLNYAVPEGVDPSAYVEFSVELLPTGEQASEPQLVKPSGIPGFDEAARRAILRTDPFPRKSDGSVERNIRLRLRPQDVR